MAMRLPTDTENDRNTPVLPTFNGGTVIGTERNKPSQGRTLHKENRCLQVSLSLPPKGERDREKAKGKRMSANQQTGSGRQSDRPMATAQLRADFADARAMMVEHGEWSIEQSKEIGAGIAEAVKEAETGVFGMLAFWCDWFAIRGEAARALRLVGDAVLDNLRRAA